MATQPCMWCGEHFTSRTVGAHRNRFCSTKCKDRYHAALRRWAQHAIDEGRITVADLKGV